MPRGLTMNFPDPPVARAALVMRTANRSQADVKVFVTKDRTQADAFVLQTTNATAFKSKYIWKWTWDWGQSDFKVFLVNSPSQADLAIYFVQWPSEAGPSKRPGSKLAGTA